MKTFEFSLSPEVMHFIISRSGKGVNKMTCEITQDSALEMFLKNSRSWLALAGIYNLGRVTEK